MNSSLRASEAENWQRELNQVKEIALMEKVVDSNALQAQMTDALTRNTGALEAMTNASMGMMRRNWYHV